MSRRTRALVVVCVVALLLPTVPGVLAAGPYGLDSPSAVDVPDRTMSIGYEEFDVRGIARVSQGEDLLVRTTAPPNTHHRVELYSSLRMGIAISDRTLRGNGSVSFETGYLTPGSYVAALFEGTEIRAVLPVVVEGYTVSVDAPDTVEAGTDATITATLTKAPASPDRSRVELVVVDRATGEVAMQRVMTADASGYSATISPDEPGEYDVYVNVRGQKSVRDQRVLLGFSDPRTLSVTAPSSPIDEGAESGATTADEGGTATTTGTTGPSTTVPEGVITRTPADGPSSPVDDSPDTLLSVVFTMLLAAGLGLILWSRG
ncbi:MAG: hypothetical protein V5A62_14100 [Haloarculaceae archaeon]